MSARRSILPEPAKDTDLGHLDADFRRHVERVLEALSKAGVPFKVNEGKRSLERQQWIFKQSPGATKCDGVTRVSRHQQGLAADLYPLKPDGKVWIPGIEHEAWQLLRACAHAEGLVSGLDWGWDAPHIEASRKPKTEEKGDGKERKA